MKIGRFPILLLAAALLGSGCATRQVMRFHVAAADVEAPNPELKFYRITIKSKASNQKASLETGWYDARAVRELYGEVASGGVPRNQNAVPGQHRFLLNPRTGRWQPAEDSELFTIVFGTDAKAIAQTIRTYAESQETGDAFSRLLAASSGRGLHIEKIRADQLEQAGLDQLKTLVASVKVKSDEVAKLPPDANPTAIGQKLLAIAQAVVASLGSDKVLRTDSVANGFADAAQQLEIVNQAKP